MRLLADENFPSSPISYLQKQKHNIARIVRAGRGLNDAGVLRKALEEKRIIFTFDKGFLSNQSKKILVNAVVFNFPSADPEYLMNFIDNIIEAVRQRKKKKKPFILVCSENKIEEIKEA